MDEIKVLEGGCLRMSKWCAELGAPRTKAMDHDTPRLIFGTAKGLQRALQQDVVDDQVFPAEFLARLRADLNGNFGSRTCKTSMGQVHDLWFTFKFKQVSSMSEVEKFSYYWDQITTFMRRDSSGAIRLIVCLDCPNSLDFQQSLGSDELKDQGMTHVALLDHIINLYDTSVWDLRNWVRSAELDRDSTSTFQPNFVHLHEVARHLIHSNETLDVAVDTAKSIRRVVEATWANEGSRLDVVCEDLKRIKRRSESLSERMQNEINLAYNLVAQRDSRIMVQLSEVSRRDNSNMRSVAVVGLIYLPATFVSGLFGMNFFQFCGGSDNDDAWKVSEKFWLYWAVTIPLTLATVLVWTLAFHADRIKVSLKKLRKYGGV